MRSVLLAVLAAVLLLPAGARAQSSPFQPLPQSAPDPTQTTAPAPSTSSGGGISSLQQTLLIGAGILFVLGIGVLIARDARRNAPADPRPARGFGDEALDGTGARKKPDPRAAQKQKAAAKRARQARKRNRPARK